MSIKMKLSLAVLAVCCVVVGVDRAGGIPFPSKRPATLELPPNGADVPERTETESGQEESLAEETERDDVRDEEAVIDLPEKRSKALEQQAAEHDDEKDADAAARREDRSGEDAGVTVPQVPIRAPPPSKRKPRIADENLGPPQPPENWSSKKINAAKAKCASLLSADNYDFEMLEPLKNGVCGTPAPVALNAVNSTPKVKIQPAGKVTCALAHALGRWLKEVVEPRAKDLLKDEIVAVTNVASYHCRPRYNDSTQRMSHHAFANAIDISEFITAKGARINPLEHWGGDDARSKFLREVHAGACRIFGTVLGPEANAAHKNHFHLDLAKRRRSAYCQ